MKDYKYKTIFSSEIKPLVSEEKDKYLAMASLVDIGDFIPSIDTDDNMDLLPIAFNACVVNRVNKNGDVINTATALDICKNFINKPINVEHNRNNVVGVILVAGFSEFGTDKALTEDQVKEMSAPFNITLGGVIWRVINRDLSEVIEESSDPTSEKYMNISASWELGFSDFNLVTLPRGEKNTENGEIIADEKTIEEMQKYLKSHGGEGCVDDATCVYRQVIGNVFALGIGLTESPAADVEGIATEKTTEDRGKAHKTVEKDVATEVDAPTLEELVTKSEKEINKNKDLFVKDESETNNISQIKELPVIPKENTMKIKSVKDLTDESIKDLSASVISDFIEEELKTASEKYAEEKAALEKTIEETKQGHESLVTEHESVKDNLEKVKADLDILQREKIQKEAEEKFNERMSSLDDDFELTNEDREVIAADIKEMEEEEYGAYSGKLQVLLKNKLKSEIERAEAETASEVKASTEAEEVIESAVDGAEKEAEELPNSTTPEEQSTMEKYQQAFSLDQFEIKY